MLTACSGGPRTEPQTGQRPTQPTVAPLPEPSIAAPQELSDENTLLSKRSIYYRNNEYTIARQYLPLVQAHAEFLGAHPDFALRVEGNCDERAVVPITSPWASVEPISLNGPSLCSVQIQHKSPP